MKPTPPQVPAALCGLFPAATIRFPHGNVWLVGKVNPFNTVHNGYVQTIRQLGGTAGVSYSSVEIETAFLLLDSPLAMCHAARWLAEQLGMDSGATAPLWYRVADPDGDGCWFLKSYTESGEVHMHGFRIASTTDPAAALAAACVAVGGAS